MKLIITFLLSISLLTAIAQNTLSPYEAQRRKINSLLDARAAKFGSYESSLAKKTGIFGLKTKKDMQRSIDILIDIMQTDNNILRQTKALLEYKDYEKTEVQSKAKDSQGRLDSYMRAINQLQDQNAKLRAEMKEMESQKTRYNLAFAALITLVLILYIWARKKSA